MQIQIFSSPDAMARYALHEIMLTADSAIKQKGSFSLVLSGGSTPEPLFRLFAASPFNTILPWQHIHLFWGDERCVPPGLEGSSYGQARRLFIDHIAIPPQNVHQANGELPPEEAAEDYRKQLTALDASSLPRFDLVLLGLGSDGHTASLFPNKVPPEATAETVIAVTADYDGRPANRITMTPPIFNNAQNIIFMVTGQNKADAVRILVNGPYQPDKYPAQSITPTNGRHTLLLDRSAAARL
jgi:6-phosphogluconolactonase